jgi:hypothetical protein
MGTFGGTLAIAKFPDKGQESGVKIVLKNYFHRDSKQAKDFGKPVSICALEWDPSEQIVFSGDSIGAVFKTSLSLYLFFCFLCLLFLVLFKFQNANVILFSCSHYCDRKANHSTFFYRCF